MNERQRQRAIARFTHQQDQSAAMMEDEFKKRVPTSWARVREPRPPTVRFGLGISFSRENVGILVLFWIVNWRREKDFDL